MGGCIIFYSSKFRSYFTFYTYGLECRSLSFSCKLLVSEVVDCKLFCNTRAGKKKTKKNDNLAKNLFFMLELQAPEKHVVCVLHVIQSTLVISIPDINIYSL